MKGFWDVMVGGTALVNLMWQWTRVELRALSQASALHIHGVAVSEAEASWLALGAGAKSEGSVCA